MSTLSRVSALAATLFLGSLLAAHPPTSLPEAPAPAALEAWLPDDVIGYVKLTGLGDQLQSFLRSDLRKDLESLGVARQLMARNEWQEFERALEEFRDLSGKDPLLVFRALLGREVVIAARPAGDGPGVILLTRAASEEELTGGLKTIENAVTRRLGFAPQPEKSSHGERTIESYDKASLVRLGAVLAVSNSRSALARVIDLAGGKSKSAVSASPLFRKAEALSGTGALLTFAGRPSSIPGFHIPSKADNPLGGLLLGGWLASLESSELIAGALRVREDGLELEVSSIPGTGGIAERHRVFFPEVLQDSLTRRLEKRGVLAAAQLHRSLLGWWERREDHLVPRAAGQLLEFSQVMSIVFGGRNFQDEVLPELGPTVTLVARNQEYRTLPEKPRPSLPGFAAIFELKSAAEFGSNMVTAFQTLIGIINADRAQKKKEGGMAMLIRSEKVGEIDLHTVSLNLPKATRPGLPYNFTPTLAVVGSRVVVSSSLELGRLLVEELQGIAGEPPGEPLGAAPPRSGTGSPDILFIDSRAVGAILEENRDLLAADNMLKKGIGKAEADGEIGAILEIVNRLRDLRLESRREGEALKLRLLVRLRAGAGSPPSERKGASF